MALSRYYKITCNQDIGVIRGYKGRFYVQREEDISGIAGAWKNHPRRVRVSRVNVEERR